MDTGMRVETGEDAEVRSETGAGAIAGAGAVVAGAGAIAGAGAGALFDGVSFGAMRAKNRFVRAATWEGWATDEGRMTPELLEVYRDLAAGGVGTILTGYALSLIHILPTPQ